MQGGKGFEDEGVGRSGLRLGIGGGRHLDQDARLKRVLAMRGRSL
jgi:hypothetical protein